MGKGKKFFLFFLIALLIGGTIFYFRKVKNGKESGGGDSSNTSTTVDNDKRTIPNSKKDSSTSSGNKSGSNTESTNLSGFSSSAQSVGSKSTDAFVIKSIKNADKDTYHEIVFALEGKSEPFVNVSYLPSANSIRVQLNQIEKDLSGIAHQSSRSIDLKGVSKIYRSVSGVEDEELYDIGVSSSTVFRLESKKLENDIWNISVLVKYPSGNTSSGNVDLGSKEFSKNSQNIAGVGSEKNASIASYTFGRSGDVLKFVWNVTADGDTPIPSVEAGYKNGKLVVEFADLVSDRVGGMSEITMSSSVKILPERNGQKSVYTFDGVEDGTEFRLSGGLFPNQVFLEIKL